MSEHRPGTRTSEPRLDVTPRKNYLHYQLFGAWNEHREVDALIDSIRDLVKKTGYVVVVADLRECEFAAAARDYTWQRLSNGQLIRVLALVNRSSMLATSVNMHVLSSAVRKSWKLAMRSFTEIEEAVRWATTVKTGTS